MALHCPVVVLQVLLAMVREAAEHRLLLQVGADWMQLVPLCRQVGETVDVLAVHWLLLHTGVN